MYRKAPPRGLPPVSHPTPQVLTAAREAAELVTLPPRLVLGLPGTGAPSTDGFHAAVGAVYGIAYSLKFARRSRAIAGDFEIGPLEARWWTPTPDRPFLESPPASWRWCLRLAVPDDVTAPDVERVVAAAVHKPRGKLAGSDEARRVELEELPGGRWARALHVGPYTTEGRSFDRIAALLAERQLRAGDGHLEVYLGDPTRTAPERLKTLLLVEALGESG